MVASRSIEVGRDEQDITPSMALGTVIGIPRQISLQEVMLTETLTFLGNRAKGRAEDICFVNKMIAMDGPLVSLLEEADFHQML